MLVYRNGEYVDVRQYQLTEEEEKAIPVVTFYINLLEYRDDKITEINQQRTKFYFTRDLLNQSLYLSNVNRVNVIEIKSRVKGKMIGAVLFKNLQDEEPIHCLTFKIPAEVNKKEMVSIHL